MPNFFNMFRRGTTQETTQDKIIEGVHKVEENSIVRNTVDIREDKTDLLSGKGSVDSITSIEEGSVGYSPGKLFSLIDSDDFNLGQVLSGLKSNLGLLETFKENEEMSRDSVIGSVMDIIADDVSIPDERTNHVVDVESDDEGLQRFLQDFLENNVNIEDRLWTWAYEVVKHGDFKLRRREYYAGSDKTGIKSVYYEDLLNPYLVGRIEYMGNVLGYEDEEKDEVTNNGTLMNPSMSGNTATFESPDSFVHFISSKSSRREKVLLNVHDSDSDESEIVTCYKVTGTSILDNVRHIYRVINILDNMILLSRIARSSQYNLVKVEVGNASAGVTQRILMDIRRRIEGSTKMKKNVGMKTDVSPIPINSNVYIPVREGKGDITVESVGDSVDVRQMVDIDYFKDKEFSALKVPKQFLGFDETLGTMGNASLSKLDIRYARSVQRVQTILINGIRDLCNNYLRFRGRKADVNNFTIRMRPIETSENIGRVEELITNLQAFDASEQFLTQYGDYIDKAKWFRSMLNLVGISPSQIGSEEFLKILKELNDGTYKEENHKSSKPEEKDTGW